LSSLDQLSNGANVPDVNKKVKFPFLFKFLKASEGSKFYNLKLVYFSFVSDKFKQSI